MGGVLFFGRLSGLEADPPAEPVASDEFRSALEQRLPQLADPSIRMVVNREVVQAPVTLRPDDEIAFLPLMSGG